MSPEAAPGISSLPYGFARRKGVLVTGGDEHAIDVVARRPGEPLALIELQRYFQRDLRVEWVDESDFAHRLQAFFEAGSEAGGDASALGDDRDLDALAADLPEPQDLLDADDDAPVIRLINGLLAQAIRENASDIHLEPFENRLSVRFRVDGMLREVLALPRALAPLLASRVKVMSELDIAERRLPQDGRMSLRVAGRPVDVRVSTLPSGHGERVVLRLLDKQAGRLDLAQLGMNDTTRERFEQVIQRPHGIVLVTGPTGSGKTTTLYAALARLNDRSRNIMTVEDPIEYHIDGLGQTQVNSRVDLSFARGLRAILRQDPDVVMVGEIRDLETAEIAVQASLTGHTVFSTLHTNSAVGSIARLRDMGIEPFLLSSSLAGVLAQRLVRRLDPDQAEAYEAGEAEFHAAGRNFEPGVTLYRPAPDAVGYQGRTGIYEWLEVTETMKQLIHDGAGEAQLAAEARRHSPSLADDGWQRAVEGITSLEEVLRVTRDH